MLVVIFLQAHFVSRAQQSEIDSLENVLKTIPVDTARVSHLNRLVAVLRERDNIKAMEYAFRAKDLAEKLNDKRGLGLALENLGWLQYRKGDYSQAFALSVKALSIAESFHDKSAIARCLNGIAAINIEQGQHLIAVTNLKKAFEASNSIGDETSMSRSLSNIGYCFLGINQMDSARVYAYRALVISEKSHKPYITGFSLRTLGDVDLQEGNYDDALIKFFRVFSISDSLQNMFLKVSSLHRIGKTYFSKNMPTEAIKYLSETVELARRHEYKGELERSLKLLSDVYASKKETVMALALQNQYLSIHDSLYQQRSSEQMALMQARFDSEIKETEIQLLTKDAMLKEQEINRQRLWMYFSIGSLGLMIILAFVLLYSNRVKKRANDELALKNKEIELQAMQLSNLNITKDKLFSIISHDLRSPLASLRGLMDIMGHEGLTVEEFKTTSRKLKGSLESVQQDLDNLLLWAQSQLNGLQSNPIPFSAHPVIDEKIQLFHEIARRKQLTILNEVDESTMIVADRNHIALVFRNLLANAIKFNKTGGLITIREKESQGFIEISVSDSGVGMSATDLGKLFNAETHFTNPGTHQEKGAGIGLLLAKEFIEKNGGEIWAHSEPDKGATFTFTVKKHHKKQLYLA